LIVTYAIHMLAALLLAQADATELEIRSLEQREANAVLQGDYATLDSIWSTEFTVNSPQNDVVRNTRDRVRSGAISYSSFVREIEAIVRRGDTVIVMGRETVVPKGGSPAAGQTVHRRFTNIWVKENGAWRIWARHANVVRS
jgi:Domain of unknown function (DUF4440)